MEDQKCIQSTNNLHSFQTVEESLGAATTLSTPQDQVEALIRQVAAENDLAITDKLVVTYTY